MSKENREKFAICKRCYKKDRKTCNEVSNETAKEIINEVAIMIMAVKAGKLFNEKIKDNPISQGAYLFLIEELKNISKQYGL